MTAVIYARYSSDNQREESIEGQIRECTAYAEKNGITVVKHYIDRALSAKTDNRPDFQQMIKDSEGGNEQGFKGSFGDQSNDNKRKHRKKTDDSIGSVHRSMISLSAKGANGAIKCNASA